jgi:hypothetical protein
MFHFENSKNFDLRQDSTRLFDSTKLESGAVTETVMRFDTHTRTVTHTHTHTHTDRHTQTQTHTHTHRQTHTHTDTHTHTQTHTSTSTMTNRDYMGTFKSPKVVKADLCRNVFYFLANCKKWSSWRVSLNVYICYYDNVVVEYVLFFRYEYNSISSKYDKSFLTSTEVKTGQ